MTLAQEAEGVEVRLEGLILGVLMDQGREVK